MGGVPGLFPICSLLISHSGQQPTCTEDGWDDYESCSRCDYSTYLSIPAKGHRYERGFCADCGEKDPDYVTLKLPKQPKNVAVVNGKKAKVTLEAEGDGLTYTWYAKNKSASKYSKSSQKGNSYSTLMNAAHNGQTVYCIVTDKYGNTVKSKTVTLKMK